MAEVSPAATANLNLLVHEFCKKAEPVKDKINRCVQALNRGWDGFNLAQREQHLLDCSYAKGEMAYILGEQEKLVEQNGGSWEVFMDLWNAEVTERDWDLLELDPNPAAALTRFRLRVRDNQGPVAQPLPPHRPLRPDHWHEPGPEYRPVRRHPQ